MENDIIIYTSGYLAVRLALLAGLSYTLYLVLRPERVTVESAAGGGCPLHAQRADAVVDDRC